MRSVSRVVTAAMVFLAMLSSRFIISMKAQVTVPTISFNEYGETMGGAPGLGILPLNANTDTLYIAFRANDSGNALWIDSTTDGSTLAGATPFFGITLGSDPSVAGDKFHGVVQVAFKSATDDTLWVCAITPPISTTSTVACQNYPSIHMIGTPRIANFPDFQNNYGYLYVSFETSNNDPAGPYHPAVAQLVNQSSSGQYAVSELALPGYIMTPPSIAEIDNNGTQPFDTLTIAYQDSATHKLVLQSVASNLSSYQTAQFFPQLVGNTPGVCLLNNYYGAYIVPFQANDPGNHLWYSTAIGPAPSDGGTVTPDYSTPQTSEDSAQIGSAPAIACWKSQAAGANQVMVTVAFQANDPGNHLWLGSQPQ